MTGRAFLLASLLTMMLAAASPARAEPPAAPPERLRLGMDRKSAEVFLETQQIRFTSKAADQPVEGKSEVLRGEHTNGPGTVTLYFVDGTLWEMKLRGNDGLCQRHTSDLGPPTTEADGCRYWVDRTRWFSAFSCPRGGGDGPRCFLVSLLPLKAAGVADDLLAQTFSAVQPPSPAPAVQERAPRRPIERAAARDAVTRLPDVARRLATKDARLVAVPDATDLTSCTGSAGECLYWFRLVQRAGARWRFSRHYGVDPYNAGRLFVATTASLREIYQGRFSPIAAGTPAR